MGKPSLRFTQHRSRVRQHADSHPLPCQINLVSGLIVLVTSGALIDGCFGVCPSRHTSKVAVPFTPSSDFPRSGAVSNPFPFEI